MIDTILDTIAKAAGLPREVWAVSAGLLASFAVTQVWKKWLPARWSKHAREVATQATAALFGFVFTYAIWGQFHVSADAVSVAAIVGLTAPLLWNLLMLVIGWWKPELKKALSNSENA